MDVVVVAIVPILLLLAMGSILRQRFLKDEQFWAGLSWMSYWVFTPALFVSSIGRSDLTVIPLGPLLVSLVVPILLVAGIALSCRWLLRADGPRVTSLVQGAVRINTYIGLIFASALHGDEGLATFALASAVVVPLVNVICVTVLAIHGDSGSAPSRPPLWRGVAGNPLILACGVGLLINVAPITLPEFASATLEMIAAPALACGTLIAGAALRLRLHRRDLLDVGVASLLKLGVLPLVAIVLAIPLGVSGATLASIVLICSVPTAPSAYVLALKMGGDARLIAAITGAQTVLAAVTIPTMLALAEGFAK